MMTDPTPLLDDPSFAASLRADLAQAKAAGVTGLDTTAGAAGLSAAIAADGVGATAAGAGVTKGMLLVFGGVIAAAAIAWATAGSAEPEPRVAAAPPVAAVQPVAAAVNPEPVNPEPVEPEPVEPELGPEPAMVVTPEAETRPAPRAARPKDTRAKPSQSDYLREAKLVAKARRVMKTDPRAALALLEEARSSFPKGLLGEEREALSILSLHALGRDQAGSRAERFLERHGDGPYAEAVRKVLR